jgi:hypothetical protein
MRMRKIKYMVSLIGVLLVAAGCSMPGREINPTIAPVETNTLAQPQIPSITSLQISTQAPSVTPTETSSPSATPFVPFTASVWADNVNVRTNPGYLFPAIRLLAKDTNLTILGKAPGGEWMFARTPDGTSGWVFAQLVQSSLDLKSVPIINPQDVQLIKGRVVDSTGTPIQGVGFAVVQGTDEHPSTNIVLTDSNGEFFSFMPISARGEWTVIYNAIACKSNVWSDDSCSYYKDPYKGMVEPPSTNISLPQNGVLEFIWK